VVTLPSITSGSHAGHAQWYILYYYSKKKAREPVAHWHAITSGHVTSLPVRAASGDVNSGSTTTLHYHLKYDLNRADILLILYLI
jgi:hypothetical protein